MSEHLVFVFGYPACRAECLIPPHTLSLCGCLVLIPSVGSQSYVIQHMVCVCVTACWENASHKCLIQCWLQPWAPTVAFSPYRDPLSSTFVVVTVFFFNVVLVCVCLYASHLLSHGRQICRRRPMTDVSGACTHTQMTG